MSYTALTLLSLPEECLAMILDRLTELHTQTLYSLLTVCKSLFNVSVRLLYYNPVQSLQSVRNSSNKDDHIFLFLRLVVLLSPCSNAVYDCLHVWINQSKKNTELTKRPYVDYLSFVRVLRFSGGTEHLHRFRYMGYFQPIFWSVCGIRLPNLFAISLPCSSLGVYACHVQDMVNISTVEFLVDWDYFIHDNIKTIQKVLAQIQAAKDFTRKLLEARKAAGVVRELDVQLFTPEPRCGPCWLLSDAWWTPVRELYALGLSVCITSLEDEMSPDGIRFLANPPNRIDLSRLHTLRQEKTGQEGPFAVGRKSSLLKHFPTLRTLKLIIEDDGEDIFGWAAGAQHGAFVNTESTNSQQQQQQHTQWLAIPPPIQHLILQVEKNVNPRLTILKNALMAFGMTLVTLELRLPYTWEIPSLCGLPQLSTFKASGTVVHGPCMIVDCPNLRVLELDDHSDALSHMDDRQMEPWPFVRTLTSLRLAGVVALRFNQASFSLFADRLEHLDFRHAHIQSYIRCAHEFSWDISQWRFLSLRSLRLHNLFA